MKFIRFFCVLFLFVWCCQARADDIPPRKKRIAVLDFSANNTAVSTARIIRNITENTLYATHRFEILEKSQRDALLKLKKEQSAACLSEECALVVGQELAADYAIIGSVDKLENLSITLKVISISRQKVILSESEEISDSDYIRAPTELLARRVAYKIGKLEKGKLFDNPVLLSLHYLYARPSSFFEQSARVDNGYGFACQALVSDIMVDNFICGLSFRYLHFSGDGIRSHHATVMPLAVTAGFLWQYKKISLLPAFHAGVSYNAFYYYTDAGSSHYAKDTGSRPFLAASLHCLFFLRDALFFSFGSEYGSIRENGGNINFICYSAGTGIMF